MKIKILLAAVVLGLLSPLLSAQDGVRLSPAEELRTIVTRIQTKVRAGQATEAALQPELAAFDALLAKYRGQKTDAVAQLYYNRAALHMELFRDASKALHFLKQIQSDFASTPTAAQVAEPIAQLERAVKAEEAQKALVGKTAPELNFTWTSGGDFKTLSALKGKVVVLDFWATWCGPCVATFPNIRELVAHYKDMDVAVVGVTSIQGSVMGLQPPQINTKGDPAKEMALMKDYIKAKDITWTVAFSQQEVFNPEYGITGIPHMVIIAPDGTVRHSGLHPGSQLAEKTQKIDAILKEFGKPVFASSPNK